MIRLVNFLQQMAGAKRLFLAFGLGMVAALGLSPIGFWPVWFVVVPLFLVLLQGLVQRRLRSGFALGWWFGFGYFVAAFHWIGFAFLVDAKSYLWMMPFAVGGLAATMAVYWGLAALAAQVMARFGVAGVFGFPLALAVTEWLRGHLMTGFPWAAPGILADGMGPVEQLAAIIGMPGLTLVILLWCALPLALLMPRSTRALRLVAMGLLLTLPITALWGQWRLQANALALVDGVGLRLVQPNISQSDKWREENGRAIFDQLMAATAAPDNGNKPTTHVIWPESAVSFLIDESDVARIELADVLAGKKVLLTGALRRDKGNEAEGIDDQVHTSVIVFDQKAEVVGHYDKWRLVPGGEFLPFEWLLRPLGFRKVVSLPGSFAAGPGPRSIAVPGAGWAGPLICYEAIFPDRLVDPAHRPDWLVNVTNDGWFGQSVGPYQHLASVRMRAVEQGLPVVRAANTGISAVFDGLGRVVGITPLGVEAVLNSPLPKAISATPYARFGDWNLAGLLALVAGIGFFLRRRGLSG